MQMQNYIWDFDGMLFDSYPHITSAFLKALGDFGKDADYDEAKALLEITFAHAFEHYDVGEEEKAIFRNYEHDYSLRPIAVPFENTYKTLEALFNSGKKHFLYTHRGFETSQHYLEIYGMKKFFTAFVDSSMKFPSKPSPDAVNWICDTYGLNRNETVMIGDREIDVLSGKNAGTFGCLFTKKENIESLADFIIKDISEVLNF
ncbi:MAG: HAD-IA family hydrolase [Clostridia bacterium]|nr:HAD-IA family hydrolase [Clostridia bacterium]